jgi:molybdenum cofactor biosynthesis enzyme MoaA
MSDRRNENRDTEEIRMTGEEKSLRNNRELCVYEGVGIQVRTLTATTDGTISVKLEKRVEDKGVQAWAVSMSVIIS